MVTSPCCFGPVVRQNIMVGTCGRGNLLAHGKQEAKKEMKGPRSQYPLQGHAPSGHAPSGLASFNQEVSHQLQWYLK
jgi:hypothetical protein